MASPREEKSAGNNHENNSNGIDREKVCPLLLRVFCATSRHNNLSDYNRGKVPSNELQIYTWMDATLKELTGLVREVNPESRRKGTFFDFAIVSPNTNRSGGQAGPNGMFCHYAIRDIGTTVSGRKGMDDMKSLAQCRFTIGDYIDIAITPQTGVARGGAHRLDRMAGDRFGDRDRDHRDDRRMGPGGGGGGGWRRGGGFDDRRRRPY